MSSSGWSDLKLGDLAPSSKQRLNGLEDLEALLDRTNLSKPELGDLVDLSRALLSDANSKVTLQALEALAVVTSRADAPVNSYASHLLPCLVERLGDSRQLVREQAFRLLVKYCTVLKPELVLEKLAPFWQSKSWKIKQGLVDVIAEVVIATGVSFLGSRDQNNAVLKQVVRMMEEPEMIVRESAIQCLTEIYRQVPAAVVSTVTASNLRPVQQREVLSRLGVPTDTAGDDTGYKRSHSSGAHETSTSGSGGGGFYMMSDVPAAVATSSGRAADNNGAASSLPAGDPGTSGRPTEPRRQSIGMTGSTHPPAATAAASKRGGFKDGGGVTVDGELPAATPIPITSERELRAELEAATATLAKAPNTEWQERMDAMQRVEGLVLGGAAEWECFHEAMKGLTQALSQQFKERRSTIARQTCHLIGVLSRAMGPRFEQHAVALLPTLFGVLVITVAVMAESADVGVRGMLRHCQTGRILQTISDGVCKEKNPKTRQWCANYIIQILEEWDAGSWVRYVDALEAAIRAAAQDSSADTRQSARTAMSLYHKAQPERAQAFLKRLDSGLQDKLSAGVAGAKPAKPAPATFSRQSVSAAIAASRRQARQGPACPGGSDSTAGIVVVVAGPSKPVRHLEAGQPADASTVSDNAAARPRPAARPATAAPSSSQPLAAASGSGDGTKATAQNDAMSRPLSSTLGRSSRKSMALPPGRIPGGSADLTATLGDATSALCDPATQARIAALRRPRMSAIPYDPPQRTPNPFPVAPPTATTHAVRLPAETTTSGRGVSVQVPEPTPNRLSVAQATQASMASTMRTVGTTPHGNGGGSAAGTGTAGPAAGGGLVPLSRVVTAILGGPRTWSDKAEALNALATHVRASVSGTSVSPGRGGSDPGAASAAASAATQLLVAEPEKMLQALERVRERLLEALDDPHQKVLAAALPLLSDVVRLYGRVLEGQLDRLLPLLLNKGAENKEQPRALCADVLNECGQSYRPDVLVPALTKCLDVVKLPRGRQTALEFFRAHIDLWGAINSTQLKHWLVRLAPLLEDRNPELRKRAIEVMDALRASPWAHEPINYVAYQHNSADVAPLRRYLAERNVVLSTNNSASTQEPRSGALSQPLAPNMTVSGGPPATTNDSRRQLPSAVPAVPIPQPSVPLSQQGAVALPAHQAFGAGQPLGQERPGPSEAAGGQTVGRWQGAAAQPQGAASSGAAYAGKQGSTGAPASPSPSVAGASTSRPYAPHPPASLPGHPIGSCPAGPPPAASSSGATGSLQGGPLPHGSSTPHVGRAAMAGADEDSRLQVPTDPAAQQALLAQIMDAARGAVSSLGTSPEQVRVYMEALADVAELCGREPWMRAFPSLAVELSAWVRHASGLVRVSAFGVLGQLLRHQAGLFTDSNLPSQLGIMMHGCGDEMKEVRNLATAALKLLLDACNPHKCMRMLAQQHAAEQELHRQPDDKGFRLAMNMEAMRILAARLEPQELEELAFSTATGSTQTLLSTLILNLKDRETPVRRATVNVLVELWCRVGSSIRDVLKEQSGMTYNLLCIYYLKLHGVNLSQSDGATLHPLVTGGGAV